MKVGIGNAPKLRLVISKWSGHEYVLLLDEFPDRKLKIITAGTYQACRQGILSAPPLYC